MTEPSSSHGPHTRILARTGSQLNALLDAGLAAGLHIVATPIGNLGDISLRAIAALAAADVLLCEDTRRARKLLSHYGIQRELMVYEEHTAQRVRPQVLSHLEAGNSVALISDAGTPLISDPGFKLVRAAIAAKIPVFTAPGPVAAVAALSVSGLPSDCFVFAGFLPAKRAARRQRLADLSVLHASLVFYESPARLTATLADLAGVLPRRDVAIMRELTKRFETHYRGTAEDLKARFDEQPPKGEVVLIVGPPLPTDVSDDVILQQLEVAMRSMSAKDAVGRVADVLKVQRKRVYDLMVAQKNSHERDDG